MCDKIFKFSLMLAFAFVTAGKWLQAQDKERIYDLVIQNGQVIDPASKTNAVMNVGVRDGSIVELSTEPLVGRQTIDATGKSVTPGFIDLHTHSPFPFGEELQALDGVTTALDLEARAFPPFAYGQFIRGKARANCGASVGQMQFASR